ncbi:MAG TPA: lipase family protein [Anaerolineales bacterium]|nr:lipase family protein [Anaerolineales bacterium]
MAGKQSKKSKRDSGRQVDLIAARDYFKDKNRLLNPPIYRAAYSDRMAWIMASMSHLAYERFEADEWARRLLSAKLNGGGFKLVATFSSAETDTQAFMATNNEYIVLAFRGTEMTKGKDIKTDIKAVLVSTIEGKVHAGFKQAYESIAAPIRQKLLQMGDLPIYITGHSLGAALATIATQSLERDPKFKDRIAACYTFGSPRVGNDQYDREFKSPIYRIVNTADIVTVIPLLAMGYTHIGDVRFLAGEGEIRRGIPILRRLFFFLAALLRLFGPLVGDHAIVEYRRKLELVAEKRNPREHEPIAL